MSQYRSSMYLEAVQMLCGQKGVGAARTFTRAYITLILEMGFDMCKA